MLPESTTESTSLRASPRYLQAKKELTDAILEASAKLRKIKVGTSLPAERDFYLKSIQEFGLNRGRDLYFPFLGSGLGAGPFVELMDGSVKYDMITGIGINFFGHTHPALVEESLEAAGSDVMQGNLEPGIEMKDLLSLLLSKVGSGSRLNHGWMTCSGTMSNEVALKIIRQKKFPATKVLAFKDCFAGRSTAMQEITDNPSYRQGQPVYGETEYLPFYDPKVGLKEATDATLRAMREYMARFPGKFAALMVELVQGEGGFQFAPRDFYVQIFEAAQKEGLAIWVDEVQTFGRTGELFAYQKFLLNEYVDVVTVGKMLQVCCVLFSAEFTPKPGLVAGTFSGSTVALRSARRVIEMLHEDEYLGKEGKIERLSQYFLDQLEAMAAGSCKGLISEIRAIGGMIAFLPFSGKMEELKAVLMQLFDSGIIAFYCGHGPYLIRFLPPFGAMTEKDIHQVCKIVETALIDLNLKRQVDKK